MHPSFPPCLLRCLLALPFAFAVAPLHAQTAEPAAPAPPATQTPSQPPAQTPVTPPAEPTPADINRPIPQLAAFMHEVEARQHQAESAEKDYIYHSFHQSDDTDSKGDIKRSESADYDVFWINGVRVARRTATNGKPLTPDEQKKENDRIDKRIAEVRAKRDKAAAEGKDPNHGADEISFARMLELGDFTNEHREFIDNRPTIVVDYTGLPNAPTHNPFENAFKDLQGRVWIDEQDKVIQHLEGHFVRDFKIGGGMIASIAKDTTFKGTFRKVNNEAWLPQSYDAHGHARILLFFAFTGRDFGHSDNYRKFKATSTISPIFTKVDPDPETPKPQ